MAQLGPERREQKYTAMRRRMAEREAEEKEQAECPPDKRARPRRPPLGRRFYRVNEIAEEFGISRQSVIRWFRDRAVVAGQKGPGPGRRHETLLIPVEAVEDWIKERKA